MSGKKDFTNSYNMSISIDDVFAKPKTKERGQVIMKTESEDTPIIENEIVKKKVTTEDVITIHTQRKNKESKVGRPLKDIEKIRDEKFTFNTSRKVAELIRELHKKHNEELQEKYGFEIDESNFLDSLIKTHPKISG